MWIVLKTLLRGNGLRLLLTWLVAFMSGYALAAAGDTLARETMAETAFSNPTLSDSYLFSYLGEQPIEFTVPSDGWLDCLHELKTMEGVEEIGLQVYLSSSDPETTLLATSQNILKRLQTPLAQGRWEEYQKDAGYIPAVLGYGWREHYQVGDEMKLEAYTYQNFLRYDLKLKVTGFYHEYGGEFSFNGVWPTKPALQDLLKWREDDRVITIPLEALPYSDELAYEYDSKMMLSLHDEYARDEAFVTRLQKELARKGWGLAFSRERLLDMMKEDGKVAKFRLTLLAFALMALEVFGRIGLQTAFLHSKRRDVTVLNILGWPYARTFTLWGLIFAMPSMMFFISGELYVVNILTKGRLESWFAPYNWYLWGMPLLILILSAVLSAGSVAGAKRSNPITRLRMED